MRGVNDKGIVLSVRLVGLFEHRECCRGHKSQTPLEERDEPASRSWSDPEMSRKSAISGGSPSCFLISNQVTATREGATRFVSGDRSCRSISSLMSYDEASLKEACIYGRA
jgi:hypothetical protein